MITTGHFDGMSRDYKTGRVILTFSIDGNARDDDLVKFIDRDVDIRVEAHRERRSKNSNAYFHVLVNRLAEALTISKAYAKTLLITKYGQPCYEKDGSIKTWTSEYPPEVVYEYPTLHAIACGSGKDGSTIYQLYRGCHTYNSKEMAALIDGAVADLMDAGIDVDV